MKFTLLIWFAICLIVTFAVIGLFTAEAYADYYRTMGVQHKYNPQVCIMLPEERAEEISVLTHSAIMEWENKLIERTGGNWHSFIFEYDWIEHDKLTVEDYPHCTIFVNFPYGEANQSVGRTGFDFSKSWRYYFWVEVDLYTIEKRIGIHLGESMTESTSGIETVWKQIPNGDIYNIILHEFGHGLGIEHYYVTSDCRVQECDYDPIMYRSITVFENQEKQVTEKDIDIMIKIYGADGYGGLKPYTPRNVIVD